MIKNELETLGLPKNSVLVFDCLLNKEEMKATEVIHTTGLHRQLVYEALRDLERRGLIKKIIRDDVSCFRVLSAHPLLEFAEEQYQAALRVARAFKQKKIHCESSVTFFQGVEGVHSFTEFVLETKKPLFVLGANTRFRQFYPEIFDLWNEKRVRLKIPFCAIVPDSVPKEFLKNVTGFRYKKFHGKLFPGVLWIFGDYIAHIVWITKVQSEIILIHNPILAAQQREFFDSMWKNSK